MERYRSISEIQAGDRVRTEWATEVAVVLAHSPENRVFWPGTPEEFQKLWPRMVYVQYPPCCPIHPGPHRVWMAPELLCKVGSNITPTETVGVK